MLKIGWAVRDFTPVRPALLQGQMHIRVARSARDPLLVTAMALEGNGTAVVLVSCDLPFVTEELQASARAQLRGRIPELPSDHIIVSTTHTHTAPVFKDGFYRFPGGDIMTSEEVEAWIAEKLVEAVAEAWQARTPHRTAPAFAHAVVGHNRRALYAGGEAIMYGQTNRPDFLGIEGYEDHSLDLLFAWDAAGRLTGVVVDIPCPSQVDEHLEEFSADYWHEVRQELRARLGGDLTVLALCGAAGDQSPHFLLYGAQEAEMRRRRGVSERQEIALRVADAVERALAVTQPGDDDTLAHVVRRPSLTPRRVSQKEAEWAQAALPDAKKFEQGGNWWPDRLQRVVDHYLHPEQVPPVTVELHALRIGSLAVVTNPFELYLDYGMRIKARSTAPQTTIAQITGGIGWYLPTAVSIAGGGYGSMPAVSDVGPEGGAELVEITLEMIGEVFGG